MAVLATIIGLAIIVPFMLAGPTSEEYDKSPEGRRARY